MHHELTDSEDDRGAVESDPDPGAARAEAMEAFEAQNSLETESEEENHDDGDEREEAAGVQEERLGPLRVSGIVLTSPGGRTAGASASSCQRTVSPDGETTVRRAGRVRADEAQSASKHPLRSRRACNTPQKRLLPVAPPAALRVRPGRKTRRPGRLASSPEEPGSSALNVPCRRVRSARVARKGKKRAGGRGRARQGWSTDSGEGEEQASGSGSRSGEDCQSDQPSDEEDEDDDEFVLPKSRRPRQAP
jgi:hypothetical protein